MSTLVVVVVLLVLGAVGFFMARRPTLEASTRDSTPPSPPASEERTPPAPRAEATPARVRAPEATSGAAKASTPTAKPSDSWSATAVPAGAPAPVTPAVTAEAEALAPSADAPTETVAPVPAPAASVAVVEAPPPAPPPPPTASAAASTGPSRHEQVAALKRGLASTRGGFIARLAQIFGGRREIDPSVLDEVEEVLLTADIGVRTTDKLLTTLRTMQGERRLADEDAVWSTLRAEAATILGSSPGPIVVRQRPTVILVVGVNGVGKTTTIGKIASRYREEGRRVVLAAGDTFRAAAVLQLEVWAKRVGCEIVKGKDRADPAAVIFEAVKKAQVEGADVVIADTAGRLHTKQNLMEELKKVVRSAEKALERPVDEILLVLDSTTGQNAIQQAQLFKEAVAVSGVVLTKLDGTAKGGVVLGIVDEHRVPVRYVGVGERIEDLRLFDTTAFVEALFERPEAQDGRA